MGYQEIYQARLHRMRKHHDRWLWMCCHRCPLTLRAIGKYRGGYGKYNMHHANYASDLYWFSIIPLSKAAHQGFIHGVLSGNKSAGEQRRYPNLAQVLVHSWLRVVLIVLLCFAIIGLVKRHGNQ